MTYPAIASQQASSDSRLVFLHIPKTGGTSLHNYLIRQYEPNQVCPERFNNLHKWSSDDLFKYHFFSGHFDMGNVTYIPGEKRIITVFREPKARILSLYFFWKAHRESVIEKAKLQGPRLAKKLSLLEFLRYDDRVPVNIPANIDNVMTRTLIGRIHVGKNREYTCSKSEAVGRAKAAIDNMACFGIMEDFEKSIRRITSFLGIPCPDQIPHERNSRDPSPNSIVEPIEREEITEEISAELEKLTEEDTIVYNYALKRFNATTPKMESSDARRLKALEDENMKLKKLLAETMLDVATLKEMLEKNGLNRVERMTT